MKEAMPYLNIYPTEEIPADMQAEVDAENAAKNQNEDSEEGEERQEGEEGEDEEAVPEGTLTDPNTGEQVKMPTEEDLAGEEDNGILGGIESPLLGDPEPEEPQENQE